jgi:hypothetical protein
MSHWALAEPAQSDKAAKHSRINAEPLSEHLIIFNTDMVNLQR